MNPRRILSLVVIGSYAPFLPLALQAQLARLEASGWAAHTFGNERGFYQSHFNPGGITGDGGRKNVTIQDSGSHSERIVSFERGFDTTLDFTSIVAGIGYASYGALGGAVSFLATATPETIAGTVSNLENTTYNYTAGRLALEFFDGATVISETLAMGTPVALTFSIEMHSTGTYIGRPSGNTSTLWNGAYENDARANGYMIVKQEGAIQETMRTFGGSETVDFVFETRVGERLVFEGRLDVLAAGLAGRDSPFDTAPFYEQVTGELQALNTAAFFIDAPAGVGLLSASGHDYASAEAPPPPRPMTPVPEPSAYGWAAALIMVLLGGRRELLRRRAKPI